MAPTTRPTVPPGPHVAAWRATRRWSGSAGAPVAAIRLDDQVLELGRVRVGRPAQDVGVAVGSLEQRGDRLAARVRIDRDRVGAQAIEQRDRVASGSRTDVGPLRVDDDRDVVRDRGADALEGGHAVRPERLVEREVGLDRRRVRAGGLEDQPDEPLHAGDRRREAVGQAGRIGVQPEAQDAADGPAPRGQPLEVRRSSLRRGGRTALGDAGVGVALGQLVGGHEPAGPRLAVEP